MKDYYKILGVPKNASQHEIRKAYRKLARQHHPDANEGGLEGEDTLKDINEAYAVLNDPAKRKDYGRSDSSDAVILTRTERAPAKVRQQFKKTTPVHPDALLRGLVIFFLSIVIYIPAMSAGFIWDDDQLLTVNQQVHAADGWWKLWLTPTTADYFPLTSSTLWLEWRFWGMNAAGYHITNILLHGIVAVITWRVLLALKIPGAWLAALIFGVHPVCVESVAWISERKNTLSQIFFLFTLLAYFRFEKNGRGSTFVWALICFFLALVAKTSVVMLPFVLLLNAWWKDAAHWDDALTLQKNTLALRTLNASLLLFGALLGVVVAAEGWIAPDDLKNLGWNSFLHSAAFWKAAVMGGSLAALLRMASRPLLKIPALQSTAGLQFIRSLPFFFLSALLGLVTIYFQYGRAIGTEVIPIGGAPSRIAKAGMAVWFYISKLLVPYPLTAIYETWKVTPPAWYEFLPDLALIALFVFCWRKRAETWARAVLFGFGFFVITMLPALGFLKMSYMRLTLVADHFQYLSMIGIIALIVAAAVRWMRESILTPIAALVVLLFCGLSWSQATIYHSEKTLWADTLRKNEATWQGHNHMGAALYTEGDKATAFKHFQRAVELKPENPEVHNNLGLGYATFGRMELAIEEYKKAISIKDDPAMRMNLGNAYMSVKRFDDAIEQYKKAIEMNPDNAGSHCNLGFAFAEIGRIDEAISELQKAVQLDPNFQLARQKLNELLQKRR